ncbi:60S ribosomal protein L27-like [Ipomoea triloba]|uniref:60S ribosomal protein L27-like n=1 Tax=Ipomoea triloba TaxID=35885 RepID=UPI00125E6AF8|nr:60S ribosomal protein L27-like [Ipomoea triloba]
MVKFLKPNKAIILLQGRYAGKKAVIVKLFEDGTRDCPYGHCLVTGSPKADQELALHVMPTINTAGLQVSVSIEGSTLQRANELLDKKISIRPKLPASLHVSTK